MNTQCKCRSWEREGNAHCLSGAPSAPFWNHTCFCPVFNKNCRVCRSIGVAHQCCYSCIHDAVSRTKPLQVFASSCYPWEGDVQARLTALRRQSAENRSLQLLLVHAESYWNPSAALGNPSLPLSDNWTELCWAELPSSSGVCFPPIPAHLLKY